MHSVRRDAQQAVRREYGRLAPLYDWIWSRYLATTTRNTLDCLTLRGTERLCDVGCGTGMLLSALGESYPDLDLHGIDITPQMLARAKRRLGDRAWLRLAPAEALPFDDEAFDVLISTSMLHLLGGLQQMAIAEWTRVLRPGGTMAITDWRGDHLATRAHTGLLTLLGRRHYAPLPEGGIEALMAGAGLEVTESRSYCAGTWAVATVCARKPH